VRTKLSELKVNKAPGIDSVGSKMLTELSEVIFNTVAELFNKSLISGDVPQDWNLANVTAIFKKSKNAVDPTTDQFSLTVNICKSRWINSKRLNYRTV